MLATPRRNIAYPDPLRTDTSDVPRDLRTLALALDLDVIYGQGTAAAMPVSTAGSPGIQGRMYVVTDTVPYQVWWDYGTGWLQISTIVPEVDIGLMMALGG